VLSAHVAAQKRRPASEILKWGPRPWHTGTGNQHYTEMHLSIHELVSADGNVMS
jgi:hypothetical protein